MFVFKRRFTYYDLACVFVIGTLIRDGRPIAAIIALIISMTIWFFFVDEREHD